MGKKHLVNSILDPLTYTNLLAMVVSAVWLLSLGYWQPISIALAAFIFHRFIIPIALIPAGILSNFMLVFDKGGKAHLERLFFFLSACHVFLILSLWCISILYFMLPGVAEADQLWGLVLANASAMSCLLLWVRGDRGNIFIVGVVEVAQVVMAALSYLYYVSENPAFLRQLGFTFACFWLVALAQMLYDKLNPPKH